MDGLNLIGIPFRDAGVEAVAFDASVLRVNVVAAVPGGTVSAVSPGIHPDPVEAGSFLSADKRQIALQFTQSGADEVRVTVELLKSEIV